MHHGTIMFDSDLDLVAAALNVAGDKFQSKAAKSVKSRVTNVKPYLKEEMSLQDFWKRLLGYIFKQDDIAVYQWSEEELAEVRKIQRERYDQWEWNYGKSPEYTVHKERRIDGCGKIEAHMNTKDGTIAELQFYGDFFGIKDHTELATALVGTELKKEALQKALSGFKIEKFFHGLTEEQFIEILL